MPVSALNIPGSTLQRTLNFVIEDRRALWCVQRAMLKRHWVGVVVSLSHQATNTDEDYLPAKS